MLRFHDLFLERQDEVIDLIQWEMGKARFSAWQEILQVANIARHYARVGEKYLSPTSVRGAVPGLTQVKETRVPKGVVGVISPWNYPFYLGVGDVIPALLAGNAVVSKADSQTALTLLHARDLMAEAGLPTDAWHVVAGRGSVVGTALIDAVDYICFTGSTSTGRTVGEQAGRRLIGASLELGGKNPLIVRKDADLQKAAEGCAAAAFANTGQMCIHIERVLVDESVYDEFRSALVAATQALAVGQTFDYTVDVGSLASEDQLATVGRHVEQARAAGASVLTGGRARPDLGPLVYEPTILEGVTPDMEVCTQETFGPGHLPLPDELGPRGGRAGQPRQLRSLGEHLEPRRTHRAPAGRPGARRLGEHQRRRRCGCRHPSRPRWAAWATAAWVVATAPRASGGTPRRRPSPSSDCFRWVRPRVSRWRNSWPSATPS